MFVVMVASECAPVAKVGGLADVVFGLSREMEIRGHAVEIILPKYDCMRYDHIWGLAESYRDLWVPWHNGFVHCTVWFGYVHGLKCFFIEPRSRDNFFSRGGYYGYPDEHMRFAFFCKAALEFMLKAGKRPDIIHCHDWQTALLPVLLFEIYKYHGMENQRVCHTIHNFAHQGICGADVLAATGLHRPGYYYQKDRMWDAFNPSALNLMKGAIVYSNFITTVSPQHAWEVRHTDQGFGLGHILHIHQNKFGGVLNGIDYDSWNPAVDRCLPHHYTVENLEEKYRNKDALRRRFWLRDGFKPLIAYVGRLDKQKGIHLIRHALFHSIRNGAQFVLLGSSSEHGINAYFQHLKHYLNDNPDCHLELGFSEELARLVYSGADMVIVPSLYEPCGLTQMIAMRYGTVPIVRGVGGLLDSVFDWNHSNKPREERNGYVFYQTDYSAIESALGRAIGLWNHHPDQFRELMKNGMSCDYSWNKPGGHYLNIYEHIRHK
ncbi:MAG: glycogen synthase GlgA [Planctomycetota bacterium]